MGHEGTGRVVAVGDRVTGLSVGDRVVIEGQVGYCGKCRYCEKGWRSLCPQRSDMGYVVDGVCVELVAINATNCYLLPDALTMRQGANVHGLAAVMRAFDRVPFVTGANVLIVGPGPAGLLHTQVAKHLRGAHQVILAGRSDHRLRIGKQLGATRAVNTRQEDLADIVMHETGGEGVDIVVDTSGNPAAQECAFGLLRKRGAFLAYARGRLDIDLQVMLKRDLMILGSTGVHGYMNAAIEAIMCGAVQVDPLITHVFALEEAQAAFDRAVAEDKGDYIKGVIRVAAEA